MILIKQKILATAKGKSVIIAPGQYQKLPAVLAADTRLVNYVKAGYVEGVELTREQLAAYTPVPSKTKVAGYEKVTPESDVELPNGQNKKDEVVELKDMKVPEIKQLIEEEGFELPKEITKKADIIAFLEEQRVIRDSEGGGDDGGKEPELTPEEIAALEAAKNGKNQV